MAALDQASGNVDAYLEKLIKQREEEEEKKKKRQAENLAKNEASTLIEDRKGKDKEFVDDISRGTGIIGRGFLSNLIDQGTQGLNPNKPSKLETTGQLLYADEDGKMPEGQTGAGALYSAMGQAVATDEANKYAQENLGTPTEIAAKDITPTSPAFNPQASYSENPSDSLQANSEAFAAELTKNKQEGVLDNPTETLDNTRSSGKESFGSDFFSAMATLATFGGMIATGVGIPFALAAAAGAWTGTEPYRQRESSAEGLKKQGYSDAEITNFVYEGILNQIPGSQVQADAQENLAIKRMEKESLVAARDAKAEAGNNDNSLFGFNTPEVRQVIQTTRTYLNDVGLKSARFDQALESANQAIEAYDRGDNDLAGKAGQGAMEAHAKAMQGGSGAVSPQVAEEYGGNPNWFKGMYEKFRRGFTGTYSRDELVRLKRSAELSKLAEHNAMDNRLQDMYWNFIQKGEDSDKTLQLVKGLAAGAGAYDWYPKQRTGDK